MDRPFPCLRSTVSLADSQIEGMRLVIPIDLPAIGVHEMPINRRNITR
jgi:hypothetical protein